MTLELEVLNNIAPNDDSPFQFAEKVNANFAAIADELGALTARYRERTVTIDGGATPIQPGDKGWLPMPFAGVIVGWYLVADPNAQGSIEIDVWKSSYESYPPDAANSICGGQLPSIVDGFSAMSLELEDWDVNFAPGDILWFHVNSCSQIRRVTLTVLVLQT